MLVYVPVVVCLLNQTIHNEKVDSVKSNFLQTSMLLQQIKFRIPSRLLKQHIV